MNLQEILYTIEVKLDIIGTLEIKDGAIVPSKRLTKDMIQTRMIDDLFQWHLGQWVYTNRMMNFVGELFDRKVKTGHYKFTIE